MADLLRHNCKLDMAEEILDFIANNPDAKVVRETIKNCLELNDVDLEVAHEVVSEFNNLIREQEF